MDPINIVFVSCAYAEHRDKQPAWRAILDTVPTIDVLLFMGDNAYMSWYGKDWLHDELGACYEKQTQVEGYKEVIARAKMSLAIWDDHDAGPDNVCGADHPEDIRVSRALFDHYMGFARNVGGPDMWGAFSPAPGVRILLTDGRTHRTPPDAANPTVLGDVQQKWLFDTLDERGAGLRPIDIVVSGVGYKEGSKVERLLAYPTFAKSLDERLRFRRGSGPGPQNDPGRRALLLAGDIHRNSFAAKGTKLRPWYEVISSGVACFIPKTYEESEFTPDRFSDNWGLLTITETSVVVQAYEQAHRMEWRYTIDRDTWVAK